MEGEQQEQNGGKADGSAVQPHKESGAGTAAADVPMGEAGQAAAEQGVNPAVGFRSEYMARDDLQDMPGYRLLHTLRGHGEGGAVTSVRFDRSGKRVASAGSDGTAILWDADSGKLLHRLAGHSAGISDVAWSPDGQYLATASDDMTLRVWEAATGVCLRVLHGHTHFVFCCAFSAGSNMLVSGGFDEVLIVWDVLHGRPIKVIPGHSDPVSGVHFSGDPGLNELIASCSFDGLTRVWHTSTGRCQASLTDAANPALSFVRFTPNAKYLLTATLDSRLLLWDPQLNQVKKTYTGHLNKRSCCQAAFVVHSPAGKYVACGSEDHHVYLWDLNSRKIAGILRGRPAPDSPGDGHCSTVLSVDAAADRQLIASGGQAGDGTVKIWQHQDMAAAAAPAAAEAAAAAAMDTS